MVLNRDWVKRGQRLRLYFVAAKVVYKCGFFSLFISSLVLPVVSPALTIFAHLLAEKFASPSGDASFVVESVPDHCDHVLALGRVGR